jgi:prophage regulatory protein
MGNSSTPNPANHVGNFQFSINETVGAQLRALRLKQTIAKSGLCRSAIYAKAAKGEFPAPFKLGNSRASAWWEHEVDAWLLDQMVSNIKSSSKTMGGI